MSYNERILNVLNRLRVKEIEESHWIDRQAQEARAECEENISRWVADQKRRRTRYISRYGLEKALNNGYHIPFRMWMRNKHMKES